MVNKKLIIVLLMFILSSLAITAAIYNKLPDEIPMHYDAEGNVDRYSNKNAVFTSATLPLLILLIMIAIPKFDTKKREQYEKNYILYNILTGLITLFIITIHWISIFVAFGNNVNMRIVASLFLGVLLGIVGAFIDKVDINTRIGIKIPTTLRSEDNWKATHKLAHYTFMIGSVILVVSAFLNYIIGITLFVIGLSIAIIVPIIYSIKFYFDNKKTI